MKRRAFLLMCAAAVAPRQRTIQVRGPYWTVAPGAVTNLPQRIVYTGTFHWRVQYVTAFGETIALPSLHPDMTTAEVDG